MSIQGIQCAVIGEKLDIRWVTFAQAHAISICVANNSEFTENLRHFVLPDVTSVQLDVGPGSWYVRLGTWSGTVNSGSIDWSNACGPITIVSSKPVVPTVPFTLPVIHKQAIQHGVRIFTGVLTPYYVLFETTETHMFSASTTAYKYVLDNGRGSVDCIGLDYNHSYIIRISTFGPDVTKFPTNSIQQINTGRILYGMRSARPMRHADTGMTTIVKSGNAILHDAKERLNMRFSSHRDYLRFQAAKAASGEEVTRI